MKSLSIQSIAIIILLCSLLGEIVIEAKTSKEKPKKIKPVKIKPEKVTCSNRKSKCFARKITCPRECPKVKPTEANVKACFLDCYSPKCEAVCRRRKPNCNGHGAACYDPRFIGGDGIIFYFHGKANENFALVSDTNLQINAHFIGTRPAGRSRDNTWIQSLGLMFETHNFTIGARKSEIWDENDDHFLFSYDENIFEIPVGQDSDSEWVSANNDVKVERTSEKNSVSIILPGIVEIFASVVPITERDDKIHKYEIPSNDIFAHLEVQFRFLSLSDRVEGVLGKTYQADFVNPAKPGVAMPVVGGENKYRTSSILSADCGSCVFSPKKGTNKKEDLVEMDYGTLDCTKGIEGGYGIVCKK